MFQVIKCLLITGQEFISTIWVIVICGLAGALFGGLIYFCNSPEYEYSGLLQLAQIYELRGADSQVKTPISPEEVRAVLFSRFPPGSYLDREKRSYLFSADQVRDTALIRIATRSSDLTSAKLVLDSALTILNGMIDGLVKERLDETKRQLDSIDVCLQENEKSMQSMLMSGKGLSDNVSSIFVLQRQYLSTERAKLDYERAHIEPAASLFRNHNFRYLGTRPSSLDPVYPSVWMSLLLGFITAISLGVIFSLLKGVRMTTPPAIEGSVGSLEVCPS